MLCSQSFIKKQKCSVSRTELPIPLRTQHLLHMLRRLPLLDNHHLYNGSFFLIVGVESSVLSLLHGLLLASQYSGKDDFSPYVLIRFLLCGTEEVRGVRDLHLVKFFTRGHRDFGNILAADDLLATDLNIPLTDTAFVAHAP